MFDEIAGEKKVYIKRKIPSSVFNFLINFHITSYNPFAIIVQLLLGI